MRPACATFQHGLTLVELLLALAAGALLLVSLDSIVVLGLKAQKSTRRTNDLAYHAAFLVDRLAAKTRGTAPKALTSAAAGTTGDWLAPIMFCFKPGKKLVETTPADLNCNAGSVLADDVTAFTAQVFPSARPTDRPAITYTVTMDNSGALQPITFSFTVRLGGGTS